MADWVDGRSLEHESSQVERQPAHQGTDHAIWMGPVGLDDMAKQSGQNGCDADTHNDPISQQVQLNKFTVPVGAEDDMPKERQHTPSKMRSTTQYIQNEGLGVREPSAKQVVHRLASQWSDSARKSAGGLSDMVNKRFDCPVINSLEASKSFNFLSGLVILLNAISMAVA
eukprot:CAMPEP_0172819896 /NCGR_PEP_ID=MMETSP1075-20121228/14907_1 /TAXON_ID=2916 /ORGANISM="Ceratium fusus, Strain PA161109" /LENGTH=169 /DNA_ID=CAMNT_0013660491 /DNA_START=69 /DNA_END=575 /DNA_ORIENTATION=-